jgi:hypothetical protein
VQEIRCLMSHDKDSVMIFLSWLSTSCIPFGNLLRVIDYKLLTVSSNYPSHLRHSVEGNLCVVTALQSTYVSVDVDV